jgi:NhaP-type Na+/H+ or K+/H+ antiporter
MSDIMIESVLGVSVGFVVAFICIYLTIKVENKKDYNRWVEMQKDKTNEE